MIQVAADSITVGIVGGIIRTRIAGVPDSLLRPRGLRNCNLRGQVSRQSGKVPDVESENPMRFAFSRGRQVQGVVGLPAGDVFPAKFPRKFAVFLCGQGHDAEMIQEIFFQKQ